MRPAGAIEEDGGRSPSPVPAVTPTDVSQKPETTPTSLRACSVRSFPERGKAAISSCIRWASNFSVGVPLTASILSLDDDRPAPWR